MLISVLPATSWASSQSRPSLLFVIYPSPAETPTVNALMIQYLTSPTDYIKVTDDKLYLQFPNQRKLMVADSLSQVDSRITQAKNHNIPTYAIAYDFEHWSATPASEQANPLGSMSIASNAVHAAGYKFGFAPDSKYLNDNYKSYNWKKVDVAWLQIGYNARTYSKFVPYVTDVINTIRTENPNAVIIVQLSLATMVDRSFSTPVDQYDKEVDTVANLKADAMSVVYHDQTVSPNYTISNLEKILAHIATLTTTPPPPNTPPTIKLNSASVNGLIVSVDGVTLPTTHGASITKISWSWGDSQTGNSFFPATHTYSNPGTYTITATSYDSNGLSTSASTSVTVQSSPPPNSNYPWHNGIITTEFWAGEGASSANGHISNAASAWDDFWGQDFGCVDTPNSRNGWYPAACVPNENPFYFALPYNDFINGNHKTTAYHTVYWANETTWGPLQSMLKNQWIEISAHGKTAYGQWEDVGPYGETDSAYVFGSATPSNPRNHNAGLDLSPALTQYLGLNGEEASNWKFVKATDVPDGPWKKIITTRQINWTP